MEIAAVWNIHPSQGACKERECQNPIDPTTCAFAQASELRVLETPGGEPPAVRQAMAEGRPAVLPSRFSMTTRMPDRRDSLAASRTSSSRCRTWATGSEKAAFELIVAAAVGAGLLRWQHAIKALDEAIDALA